MKRRSFLATFTGFFGLLPIAAPALKASPARNIILGPGVPRQLDALDPGAQGFAVYRNYHPDASAEQIQAGRRLEMVKSYDADTGEVVCYAYESGSARSHGSRDIFGYRRNSRRFLVDQKTGEIATYKVRDNWAVFRIAEPEGRINDRVGGESTLPFRPIQPEVEVTEAEFEAARQRCLDLADLYKKLGIDKLNA